MFPVAQHIKVVVRRCGCVAFFFSTVKKRQFGTWMEAGLPLVCRKHISVMSHLFQFFIHCTAPILTAQRPSQYFPLHLQCKPLVMKFMVQLHKPPKCPKRNCGQEWVQHNGAWSTCKKKRCLFAFTTRASIVTGYCDLEYVPSLC